MKKFLTIFAILFIVCATGLNARNDRAAKHKFIPKNINDAFVVCLDSMYDFEDMDSLISAKTYYTRDTATNSLVIDYYVNDEAVWYHSSESFFYGQDGKIRYMLRHETDSIGNMYLADSTVYSYNANQEMQVTYIDDDDDKSTPMTAFDSIYIERNSVDSVTLQEWHRYYEHKWNVEETYAYEYDSISNLLIDIKYIEDSICKRENVYFYDENGVDTLELAYRYRDSLYLWGKKVSTVDEYGNKAMTYWITGTDTFYVDTYMYDALNRLIEIETTLYGDKENKWVITYDQWGNTFTESYYEFDDDLTQYTHDYTTVYFYSEHEPSSVVNVANDKMPKHNVYKYMFEGKVYIVKDGVTYDMSGRIVK